MQQKFMSFSDKNAESCHNRLSLRCGNCCKHPKNSRFLVTVTCALITVACALITVTCVLVTVVSALVVGVRAYSFKRNAGVFSVHMVTIFDCLSRLKHINDKHRKPLNGDVRNYKPTF